MKPAANEIDRQAAEWAVAVDAGRLSAGQQSAFEAWLAQDARHRGAYLKARMLLARVRRAGETGHIEYVPHWFTPARRRAVLTGSIAASLAALVLAVGLNWGSMQPKTYFTAIGETKTASLADGSTVTLNTDTRIAVHFRRATRTVTLEHGEALFDVAKDRSRPFVVHAGPVQVRAVGTSFVVQSLANRPLQVLVREGTVRLGSFSSTAQPIVTLHANSRATIVGLSEAKVETLTKEDVEQDLAWREGRISFRHQTLADAAKAFARYSKKTIMIADPQVARLTVTGSFVATDPAGFAKAAALSYGLNATENENGIYLTYK